MILNMIFIFFVVLIADMLWVHYIDYVATYKPILAANFAVLVYGASSVAIIAYTSDAIYLIPAFVGAWIGTYVIVKWKKRKSEKK